MKRVVLRALAAGLIAVASAACSRAVQTAVRTETSDSARAPVVAAGPSVNDADARFMSGMIPHHAQAVVMAGWAATHGARSDVRILCERIVVGQRDEIALMQTWLRDRGQPVPDATSTRMRMVMNGKEHDMLMPGMLSDEEMAQLDRARGSEFDRLFLLGMIKHHQGAIDMVEELFASYGAAQDETVFRFASDVYADQSTEIDRMQTILATLVMPGGPAR